MNPNAILTYGQILPLSQNRHPIPRHPASCQHPERTPTRHSSTLARSASTSRSNREDDAGDQDATADAVAALNLLLEARMRRRLLTVVDATNARAARQPLVAAAKRHGMPVIALMVATPAAMCTERQRPRPANRTVPDDTVRQQHTAMVRSHPTLLAEGFNEIVFSDMLHQLLPYLERLSGTRRADLGLDDEDGLGDLLVVRRVFGEEILPLWQWKPGSDLAGGDRVAEIRLGQQYLLTRQWFDRQYTALGRTLGDIAEEAGVSQATLIRRAAHWGIPRRPPPESPDALGA
ncbi:AAA family ATPase [Streptomyces sp. NPDC005576]|uniref:AAA family ATPase n=1 Tax=Streptomyces sp. NPDC005576 TaxID=3364726 RepID=UPI0036AD3353